MIPSNKQSKSFNDIESGSIRQEISSENRNNGLTQVNILSHSIAWLIKTLDVIPTKKFRICLAIFAVEKAFQVQI